MVTVRTQRALEFACHSKACAPPPAGKGGSSKGASGGGSVKASDLKSGDRVHFAQKVRTVSTVGKQGNGKIGISFKDGGDTDLRPGQTLPRASNKVTVPRTTWKNNRDRTTTTNQSDLTKRMARLKSNDASFKSGSSRADRGKTRKDDIMDPADSIGKVQIAMYRDKKNRTRTPNPRAKRRGAPYDPGEQDRSNDVWA